MWRCQGGLLWPRLQKSHSISSIRFSWLKKIRRPAGWMDQQCQVTKCHAYWAERNLWPLSNLAHTYTLASSILIQHVSRRISVVMGLFLIVVTIRSSSISSLPPSTLMCTEIFLWAGHSSEHALINSFELNKNPATYWQCYCTVNWCNSIHVRKMVLF